MAIDYANKARILRDTSWCSVEKKVYKKLKFGSDEDYELYNKLAFSITSDAQARLDFLEAHKINEATYNRTERLKKRIDHILTTSNNVLFLTLTFKDSVLSSTSLETRRRYVARFLKSQSDLYVANIDYGSKNAREHYHAVISCDKIDGTWWRENCGAINFEKVRYTNNKVITIPIDLLLDDIARERYIKEHTDYSCVKLSKYIAKLTNHAIKETTKRHALIYSR